ncbi:MAG TPA: hypothetical protein VF461_02230 [Gemmatimonadaceae bacterium]
MPRRSRAALAALLLAVAPAALSAQGRQSEKSWTLNEQIPAGKWLRVRNVNGAVRVTAATTDRVEIVATKSWERGDPKMVRIESRKAPDGSILVCALWSENATCTESGYHSNSEGRNNRDNDVAVEFEVRLPKGVNLGAWSVNGGVSVDGATGEVEAGSVNGSVDATSSGGPVQASSVNGSVHARMGRLTGDGDLDFSTVNGSVIAEFGEDIDANIELSTVNGRFQTDWPVTITGRVDPRHLRATLGKGGRRVRLSTVNGNVELRKRG